MCFDRDGIFTINLKCSDKVKVILVSNENDIFTLSNSQIFTRKNLISMIKNELRSY